MSIVVPFYERIDLIEHQIAHFWQDRDFHKAGLIYVLDFPHSGAAHAARREPCTTLRASLQVLELNRNGGDLTTNNLAAAEARDGSPAVAELRRVAGWAGMALKLREFTTRRLRSARSDRSFSTGRVDPHAGMYFARDASTATGRTSTTSRGSAGHPAADVSRPVPADTGACLMVERALFDQAGGLSAQYVQGGDEDSNLCLRLIEAGARNWYLAGVELYHLEAQSFPIHVRSTNRYNAALQTHLWDNRIEQMMAEQPDVSDARVVAIG